MEIKNGSSSVGAKSAAEDAAPMELWLGWRGGYKDVAPTALDAARLIFQASSQISDVVS